MAQFRTDPAARRFGPKPTDHDLPIEERTHAAPYLAAIVVVLVIGIALVGFAIVGFTDSTTELDSSAEAVAPAEQLAPPTTGSITSTPRGSVLNLDRDVEPTKKVAPSEPSDAVPAGAD